MRPISLGELRDYIGLQRVTNIPDGIGGYSQAYSTYASVFARVSSRGYSALFRAARDENRILLSIIFQKPAEVSDGDFIVYDGMRFPIHSFDDNDLRFVEVLIDKAEAKTIEPEVGLASHSLFGNYFGNYFGAHFGKPPGSAA